MPHNPHLLFLTSYAPSTERPRAYNILRGLARHFRVSLIAQVRSAREHEAVEAMRDHCDLVEAVALSRRRALLNCLLHLATPVPLRAAYFFNPRMKRAIARRLAVDRYDIVHVEHLMAAHFAAGLRGPVRSFDAIDSIARLQAKILRFARSPLDRLISLEELPKVRRYEPRLCRRFDCVLVSTELDREALAVQRFVISPHLLVRRTYHDADLSVTGIGEGAEDVVHERLSFYRDQRLYACRGRGRLFPGELCPCVFLPHPHTEAGRQYHRLIHIRQSTRDRPASEPALTLFQTLKRNCTATTVTATSTRASA